MISSIWQWRGVRLQALVFEERQGRHALGANVRDAACYISWALARAFRPSDLAPYVSRIATSLVCVALFDREINVRRWVATSRLSRKIGDLFVYLYQQLMIIREELSLFSFLHIAFGFVIFWIATTNAVCRPFSWLTLVISRQRLQRRLFRAASAAFQENVGRQCSFPNGIEILTLIDYFAVGMRRHAYLEVSVEVAKYSLYSRPLIEHLADYKVTNFLPFSFYPLRNLDVKINRS